MPSTDLWWLDSLKEGDLLEVQPYWNETTRTEQMHGPLEVVGIRRTARCQSGVLVSVKPEGRAFATCLDAAWFVGPSGAKKVKGRDVWWNTVPKQPKQEPTN